MLKSLKSESRVLSSVFIREEQRPEVFFGLISRGRVGFDAALSTISTTGDIVERASILIRRSNYYDELRLIVVAGISREDAKRLHEMTGSPILLLDHTTLTPLDSFSIASVNRVFKEYIRQGGLIRIRLAEKAARELLKSLNTDTLL